MVMPSDWHSLQAGGHAQEAIWSFTLQAGADGQTRLIARIRGGPPPTLVSRLMGRLFWEPAHFLMEQKMLRTIRDLAEGRLSSAGPEIGVLPSANNSGY
jgi:hypothetical protein